MIEKTNSNKPNYFNKNKHNVLRAPHLIVWKTVAADAQISSVDFELVTSKISKLAPGTDSDSSSMFLKSNLSSLQLLLKNLPSHRWPKELSQKRCQLPAKEFS